MFFVDKMLNNGQNTSRRTYADTVSDTIYVNHSKDNT
jgi:hypothetical protein